MSTAVNKISTGSSIRLHIGGKEKKDGWYIMNISPGPNVDIVGDIRDLTMFENNSCNMVYASHVLEHIGQREIINTLKEINRIIEPDGIFMISVPDLDVLCYLFTNDKLNKKQKYHVMRMMFGGQLDDNDFHYIGLNEDFLTDFLRISGFKDIECVDSFGIFKDTNEFAPYGQKISLNIKCYKKRIFRIPTTPTMKKNTITWISSYPQSGNTWMRFIITRILTGEIDNSRKVESFIPDIHYTSNISLEKDRCNFIKTHWRYSEAMPGRNRTHAAIYVIRNPLDVFASNIKYLGIDDPEVRSDLLTQFISKKGLEVWEKDGFGTWMSHYDSWMNASEDHDVIKIRYEDLLSGHEKSIRSICSFLGVHMEDQEIDKVVQDTSFLSLSQMQCTEQNQKESVFYRDNHERENKLFLSIGKQNEFTGFLSPSEVEKLAKYFEKDMNHAGYSILNDSEHGIIVK